MYSWHFLLRAKEQLPQKQKPLPPVHRAPLLVHAQPPLLRRAQGNARRRRVPAPARAQKVVVEVVVDGTARVQVLQQEAVGLCASRDDIAEEAPHVLRQSGGGGVCKGRRRADAAQEQERCNVDKAHVKLRL